MKVSRVFSLSSVVFINLCHLSKLCKTEDDTDL